jgi:hypothetical protein
MLTRGIRIDRDRGWQPPEQTDDVQPDPTVPVLNSVLAARWHAIISRELATFVPAIALTALWWDSADDGGAMRGRLELAGSIAYGQTFRAPKRQFAAWISDSTGVPPVVREAVAWALARVVAQVEGTEHAPRHQYATTSDAILVHGFNVANLRALVRAYVKRTHGIE